MIRILQPEELPMAPECVTQPWNGIDPNKRLCIFACNGRNSIAASNYSKTMWNLSERKIRTVRKILMFFINFYIQQSLFPL